VDDVEMDAKRGGKHEIFLSPAATAFDVGVAGKREKGRRKKIRRGGGGRKRRVTVLCRIRIRRFPRWNGT